jgi:undecaprenyl-diphosphatase
MNRAQTLMARFDVAEYRLCRRINRGSDVRILLPVMRAASRLGDGVVWYLLMALLPLLYGARGGRAAIVMVVTGSAGLLLYKLLKRTLVRERPFIRHPGITLAMPPLDRYSFPSGHTLHAVSFTTQAVVLFPELGWVLVPLTTLIAASRVVLGLHYPTDVAAGAVLGFTLAAGALALV